jgi:hypothetical protein
LNFDYTHILLFGFLVFEPMVLLTNIVFFIFCWIYFKRLNKFTHPYARQMARFMIFLGTSSFFGAIDHAVHYQLGIFFFKGILFLMNTFSLLSIYFCFRAAYTYIRLDKEPSKKYIYFVMAWISILLIVCILVDNFEVIKIHAAIVLLYSLFVHYRVYRQTREDGTRLVVIGILISFLPIIVHSLRFSLSEWFNYKDIAHVIMIISLIVIYRGAQLNVLKIEASK